jgi:hypothetical protein
MKILAITFGILLFSATLWAQSPVQFTLKNKTLLGSDAGQPFWHTANQLGKITTSHAFQNQSEVGIFKSSQPSKLWNYHAGALLVGTLSKESEVQINQAFGGFGYKRWALTGGLWADETELMGLSTSNGNFARSLNSRPVPKLRFHTKGFVPFFGNPQWLDFKAEYDEGILNDDRYVSNTHLHHKSFFARFKPGAQWNIDLGLEHFVMWGGTSTNPTVGRLPDSFKDYLIYVSGSRGDEDFLETDQINVAGNQYGTYQVRIEKKFDSFTAGMNLSHPFEDLSGVNWRNWTDMLMAVYVRFHNEKLPINALLYEFTDTRNQSVKGWKTVIPAGQRIEPDTYFTHSIYRSGVTYHQRSMGTPLFEPLRMENNQARGPLFTRVYAHHLGATGQIGNRVAWKTLLTQTYHLRNTFYQPLDLIPQFSALLEAVYTTPKNGLEIGASWAADFGDLYPNRMGIQLSLAKKFE